MMKCPLKHRGEIYIKEPAFTEFIPKLLSSASKKYVPLNTSNSCSTQRRENFSMQTKHQLIEGTENASLKQCRWTPQKIKRPGTLAHLNDARSNKLVQLRHYFRLLQMMRAGFRVFLCRHEKVEVDGKFSTAFRLLDVARVGRSCESIIEICMCWTH